MTRKSRELRYNCVAMATKNMYRGLKKSKDLMTSRIFIVYCIFALFILIIITRLIEIQVVKGSHYSQEASRIGSSYIPAKRGGIFTTNVKNNELTTLATNVSLDLVYIDPFVVEEPPYVADVVADTLLTADFHERCSNGSDRCPRELRSYYSPSFDPLYNVSTSLNASGRYVLDRVEEELTYDIIEIRRQFSSDIEDRIAEKLITFVPLLYGASKLQMQRVSALGIKGVTVVEDDFLIYANPEELNQSTREQTAKRLSPIIEEEEEFLFSQLRSRNKRYVPIMQQVPVELSTELREAIKKGAAAAAEKRAQEPDSRKRFEIVNPLRSIAFQPEHQRVYPEDHIAAQVVGFVNAAQEPQSGIERSFSLALKGQQGERAIVNDRAGGTLLTDNQVRIEPEDGDSVVLTIDRFAQRNIEEIMDWAIDYYDADSGQAIVMDPKTGRIIAMVNAPTFDPNAYASVFRLTPFVMQPATRDGIVVEIFDPVDNTLVAKSFVNDIFTPEGRQTLSTELQADIFALEQLYDLTNLARYYKFDGEHSRREIFPTEDPHLWLRYTNTIGIGAYRNKIVQDSYEPGSVMKSITMAIGIDQGEFKPSDLYYDSGEADFDQFTIRNAFNSIYGSVTMTNCIEFSINTCMAHISTTLGKILMYEAFNKFGFGTMTNIGLEDEQPGVVHHWEEWRASTTATASYGQGITVTPLQMIAAYAPLANGGKLMKPYVIDSVYRSDGTIEKTQPKILDRVISQQTSQTMTAMLTSSIVRGFADSAAVANYRLAGKTGTSQIAGPGGRYEAGAGSNITSFIGYGPSEDPEFLILVKFDRPRRSALGSQSAAPTFRRIADFLLEYLAVEPS